MMTKYKILPVSLVYEISSGLSKPKECFGSGDPFLSFSTVFNNPFLPDQITDLVQSTALEQESCSIKKVMFS